MKPLDDDWKHVGCTVALERPEYLFELDEYRNGVQQMLFVHLRVNVWSKKVLKQLLHEFNLFRQCVSVPLYALNPDEDDKWTAFIAFFGFRFLTEVVCENGERRRLYINLKEEENGKQPHSGVTNSADVVADEPVGRASSVSDAGV